MKEICETTAMASAEHPGHHGLPIAVCALVSVLVLVFFGACFLFKKRRQNGHSADAAQEQQEVDGSRITPSTSSSSDPEPGHEYEVFLSFRGSDNRKTFTDYLYYSLTDAGVRTFMDNEELRAGEEIGAELMRSIKQSKIAIPIFSKNYASSKWCLKEVAEMVKCMKETKHLIVPVFLDVTPDEVQHQTGTYAKSFARHEKRFSREIVRGWRDALQEVVKLKGLELSTVANGNQGEFVKFIVARVIRQLKKSHLELSHILVGIEDRAEELVQKLEVGIDDMRIIGVWGMGGIGKTTLAKFVYNRIVEKFEADAFLSNIRETSRNPRGLQYLQSKLVSDILRREMEDYANVEEGINVIKERLRHRKSLILLDDVDRIDQLKALVADLKWFGRGSRIIITTREKEVLDQLQVKDLYEVALLDKNQAFELFCNHAFGDKQPRTGFVKQAWDIVNITGRLPLALEVIGSSIQSKRKEIWESIVEQLKKKPYMNVQDKLKISYESLDREPKEIFLDIACFFIGVDMRIVIPMWHENKLFPKVGLEILQLKSLIKIGEDNTIWMHDQLRDLGRDIVEQETKEPGQRSRLWHCDDAVDVLLGHQGTSKVEAISLEGHHLVEEEEEDCFNDAMFKNLSRLRVLELDRVRLDGNFQHLFYQLRWLSWHRENISPPQNLAPKNLIILDLSWSKINDDNWTDWSSTKVGMKKLKVLNLRNCRISTTPDFSAFPSLESLILESCERLVRVDPSIGLLKNLILLDLRKCSSLKELPEELGSMESLLEFLIDHTEVREIPLLRGMKKLEILSANNCEYLAEIPASIGSLVNLKKLLLKGCSRLEQLPVSIGQLTSLVELTLSRTNIRRLPDFVGDGHDLESLKMDDSNITCLPSNMGSLKKLKVLDASWYYSILGIEREISDGILGLSSLRFLKFYWVKSLPPSLTALSCLQTLYLGRCPNLQTLPELPPSLLNLTVHASSKLIVQNLAHLVNLRKLSLREDFELKEECLSSLSKLEKLSLKSIKICALPKEIGAFLRLRQILISGNQELKCLPTLPSGLSSLRIYQCVSLERLPGLGNLISLKKLEIFESPMNELPDLSKLKNLYRLDVEDCRNLVEIQGLGSLGNCLEELDLRGLDQLSQVEGIAELESLQKLCISDCSALRKLPNLSKLQRLETFVMNGCENITEFPAGLWELSSLKFLDFSHCAALTAEFHELFPNHRPKSELEINGRLITIRV